MMVTLDPAVWTRIGHWIGSAGRLVLFSDFDGTLSPIVPQPDDARIDEETERILGRMAQSPRVKVAVISGRALADLEHRVMLAGAYLAGSHGLEMRGPTMDFVHPDAADRVEAKEALAERLRFALERVPGAYVEEKPYSLACHYRATPRHLQGMVIGRIRRILPTDTLRWRILKGLEVIEILPVRWWTKESCARLLLAHYDTLEPLGAPTVSIAIGDDATDQDLFRAISPRGITVAVGNSSPLRSDYRLADIAEVRCLLSWLLLGIEDATRTGTLPMSL